jgi:hypothetical protein
MNIIMDSYLEWIQITQYNLELEIEKLKILSLIIPSKSNSIDNIIKDYSKCLKKNQF